MVIDSCLMKRILLRLAAFYSAAGLLYIAAFFLAGQLLNHLYSRSPVAQTWVLLLGLFLLFYTASFLSLRPLPRSPRACLLLALPLSIAGCLMFYGVVYATLSVVDIH
jgi:hypothetical protein